MRNIALEIENVSKQYRLGQVGTGTLSHDLNRMWHRMRGKEDPYLKIGEANDRTNKGNTEYVWALQDVNFQVEQGSSLGLVGRNGAGKSTLLKLLSKVTKPTTGSIKYKGRIASLLEVGTGFHPEMTGRENIYLNGAILGMTRKEIKRKFDEIVDFAGVERYIDTPVKRYSSGMYVRLAFAVAAHLESEILIVDEVLAVGDAEFQKKCLGKMGDVSKGEGRTVLFVSHNMAAVKELCTHGLLLKNGQVDFQGSALETVIEYQRNVNTTMAYHADNLETALGNEHIKIVDFSVSPIKGEMIAISSGIKVHLRFFNNKPNINLDATFELRTSEEIVVFHMGALISTQNNARKDYYDVVFEIPANTLNAGNYYFRVIFGENQRYGLYANSNIIGFEVENENMGSSSAILPGIIRPNFDFKIN